MRKVKIISICIFFIIVSMNIVSACTGFTASDDNKVLVGSNEDSFNTRRYVEIYPPEEGIFGKIFFCYERAYCQQAMNDQGLFYDGFWAPHFDIQEGEGKPSPPDGWMIDDWMNTCSTVDEVIESYESYDWRDSGIEDAMLFFVDRQGNSAIIEGDGIVYKAGNYQVVTNFYQTHPELGGFGFDRYETAIDMLENMDDFSMEYFRDICDATHQLGSYPTIYSLVCDLTQNIIHYYYHHNYEDVWEINLNELFEYGIQTYDVLDVFNNHEPSKPNKPIGPHTGSVNKEYEFSCTTLDIDGDQMFYKWDWGDGNISEWLGPYNSGELCHASYSWSEKGEYSVRVKARDTNTGKSEWSKSVVRRTFR
ncbi:MAG: hypothetical protein JSV67_01990 [Thermoplasmatales archaeon]|nr:MAG: hypothetical protein JSV67_01990 [Thermoplasmatales archaeon]